MTILQIPTTPFSRRILEAEHVHLPSTDGNIRLILKVAQSDFLFQQLGSRRVLEHLNPRRLEQELSCRVHLSVHDNLADATHRNVWHTGYYLNLWHRERLNEAIWWECRGLTHRNEQCRLQAKQVIETFCQQFGIELDVDINYGTLYKSWTRFRQCREQNLMNLRRCKFFDEKKTSKTEKKTRRVVRQKQRKKHSQDALKALSYLDSELDAIAQHYIEQNPKVFVTKRNKPRVRRKTQLRCFVFHKIGKRKLRELPEVLGMPEKSIYTAAIVFAEVLLHAPAIEVPPRFIPAKS